MTDKKSVSAHNFMLALTAARNSIHFQSTLNTEMALPVRDTTLEKVISWAKQTQGDSWDALSVDLTRCRKCSLKNVVKSLGAGNPEARILVVGDQLHTGGAKMPLGLADDEAQLFKKILSAISLTPDDIWMTHMGKCGGQGITDASVLELQPCVSLLRRQIQILRPQMIWFMGEITAQLAFDQKIPLSARMAGVQTYEGTDAIVTYHPRDLLVDPDKKRAVWQQVQLMMRHLEGGGR